MRRILCIVVACIMAMVFMLASDVSALSLTKIQTTDWDTKVVFKRYNETTGQYISSGVGRGITDIKNTNVDFQIALFAHVGAGINGSILGRLSDYTFNATKNKLKSILCDIAVYRSDGSVFYSYLSGACTAKITFTTNKKFKGTITFTDGGNKFVITIKGKKLGNYIEVL